MPRLRGYAALYVTAVLFAFTSLMVKLASAYYPGLLVSWARFVLGALLCVAVLAFRYRSLKPARPGLVALRGILGAVAMAMTYAAISLAAPGRVALLSNTYPLFVALFGALFFGERLEARVLASVAVCTAGAFLVMRDGSGASPLGDALALGSAVLAGVAVNVVRRATATDNPFMLYLSPCLFGLPLVLVLPGGPSALGDIGDGGAVGLLLLAGVGLCAFAAQALMAYGYRSVPAGRGSVVFYLETLLTVALGIAFAGEKANWRFAGGLALILGGLAFNHARRPGGSGRDPLSGSSRLGSG
jgi:drug/metabolite transporter (DMT)-like permease